MKLYLLPLALGLGYSPPTTPVIELPGYFSCRASLLTTNQNAAFACYASTQQDCQKGAVILAYETRVGSLAGKGVFTIVDTVRLTLRYPNNNLSISSCAAGAGPPRQYFVLCKDDALGKKYLRNVLRIWGVNAQGKLVELPVKTLRCLNDDFGA
jgi:hypothetical protein